MVKRINRCGLLVLVVVVLFIVSSCKKNEPTVTVTDEKTSGALGKPVIFAAEPEFDFGKVKQGESVEHIYKIKNTGDKELILEKATSSCGCTTSVLSTGSIPPGGEGEVKAVFNTRGRKGISSKRITVFSNDPDNPKFNLTIKGEILVDIEVTPSSISFGEIPIGQSSSKTASLRIVEPEKVKIKSVLSGDSRFRVKQTALEQPGVSEIEITFDGQNKAENISTSIKLELEGAGSPDFVISVRAQIVGNLKFPQQVHFTRSEDGFNPRNIDISSRLKKQFKVKKVSDSDNRLKFTYPKTSSTEVQIVAEVIASDLSLDKSYKGLIKVETTDTTEPVIEIKYVISQKRNMPEIRSNALKKLQTERISKMLKEKTAESSDAKEE